MIHERTFWTHGIIRFSDVYSVLFNDRWFCSPSRLLITLVVRQRLHASAAPHNYCCLSSPLVSELVWSFLGIQTKAWQVLVFSMSQPIYSDLVRLVCKVKVKDQLLLVIILPNPGLCCRPALEKSATRSQMLEPIKFKLNGSRTQIWKKAQGDVFWGYYQRHLVFRSSCCHASRMYRSSFLIKSTVPNGSGQISKLFRLLNASNRAC